MAAGATGTDDVLSDGVVASVVPKGRAAVHFGSQACASREGNDNRQPSANARVSATIQDNTLTRKTGGGGNRTRVPEHFGHGFYVRSRSFESRRPGRRSTGFRFGILDYCLARPRPSVTEGPALKMASCRLEGVGGSTGRLFRRPWQRCCQIKVFARFLSRPPGVLGTPHMPSTCPVETSSPPGCIRSRATSSIS